MPHEIVRWIDNLLNVKNFFKHKKLYIYEIIK